MIDIDAVERDVKDAAERRGRYAEMTAHEKNMRALDRQNANKSPKVATGKAGLDNMFTIATFAPERWQKSRPVKTATAKASKKPANRKNNKAASKSRRKNRG